MDRKDIYDAVWKRRSVRKYLDRRIEGDKIEALTEAVRSLNGASGLTMEFVEDSDSFHSIKTFRFKNVRSVIVLKGKTDDPDLYEKCGYYGEQIVLEATSLGLGTCWVALTFNKKSKSLNIGADEEMVCVVSVGYGAEAMAEPTSVPDAPHRRTKSVSDFLGGGTDAPDWVKAAVKSVQFAPTAMNSQKARFRYAGGALTVEIPPGRLNMVDLGISKLHFELAAGGRFPLGTPSEFAKDG
ncbi:MAG: nitroreductase family protein [Methanomassiliicoccaceae archaeon]|nr:nitroreductase family protein [Methanomassiliicoccaceae archaeon]